MVGLEDERLPAFHSWCDVSAPAHVNEITLALGFLASGGGVGIALKWFLERSTSRSLADATIGEAATSFSLAVTAENTQLRAENKALETVERSWRTAARKHFRTCTEPEDDLRSLL